MSILLFYPVGKSHSQTDKSEYNKVTAVDDAP